MKKNLHVVLAALLLLGSVPAFAQSTQGTNNSNASGAQRGQDRAQERHERRDDRKDAKANKKADKKAERAKKAN